MEPVGVTANLATATETCPQCGSTYEFDPYFIRWCEHCDWQLDPSADGVRDRKAIKSAAKAKAQGERLFSRLSAQPLARPGWSLVLTLSIVIAILVDVASIGVVALGALLVIRNLTNPLAYLVGIPLLAVGVFIAPRRRRLDPRGTVLLTPGSAPNLYALVNRVSQSIGGQSAQIIAVNGAFNASHELFGWRRRRVLRIGLPLWNILTDEERLALLAHEMAHQVNGDIAHSLVLSTALHTLFGWKRAFIPTRTRRRPGIGEMGGQLLTALLGATVDLLIELELWLMYANKQRAEYFADSLATRVASTDATVAMLGRLMLGFTARTASSRTETGESSSFWELQREALRRTPAKEIERIRRVDERRGTAIDTTHPPTSLRIKMLRQHPPHPATITISTVESSAIEQELAPAYNEIDQLMKGLVIRG